MGKANKPGRQICKGGKRHLGKGASEVSAGAVWNLREGVYQPEEYRAREAPYSLGLLTWVSPQDRPVEK